MRKLAHLPTTWLLATFVLFISMLSACSQEGKVGEAASLYGTASKKWTLDKETAADGDKVAQAGDDDQTFTFFQTGKFNMATAMDNMSGTYKFDQAGKKLTLTDEDMGTDRVFGVTTLTDDHLTLSAPDGSTVKLKAE